MKVDWQEKARQYGIDPAVLTSEPEPVEGPVLEEGVKRFHERGCIGSFRLVERTGPIWTAQCTQCRELVTVAARRLDPRIRQEGLLMKAGVPASFAERPFERDPDNQPVLNELRLWIDSFDRSLPPAEAPLSLLPAPALYGLTGRGKTHLLVALCIRVIRECELSVAFCTTRQLLADLQRFDNDVVRGDAWKRATTVDLLALDDLGAEQTTDWRLDQLAHLIDERYQRELPILVATNFPPSQWEQVLDARSVSRLSQMTFPLELGGPDRRLKGVVG